MNQFVPQLMAGAALSNSTGPPLYKPEWLTLDTWHFGSQYFFEVHNATSNATEAHAATGQLHPTEAGEVLYTRFALSSDDDDNWVWTLTMGVEGDETRVSTVVSTAPYMGLLSSASGSEGTSSWSEETYSECFVGSCWELYGMRDREHYPSSGSIYDMRVKVPDDEPGAIDWMVGWEEDEVPDCPGAPGSLISESHNATQQDVSWKIFWNDTSV